MASRTLLSVLFLGCLGLAVGCAPAAEEEEADVEEGALGRVGSEQLPTTEPSISLLDGYNTLFDSKRDKCVRKMTYEAPLVGQPEQHTTAALVKTETELATELGLDASLSVKTPIGSGEGTASLLRSFKGSSQSVNYLLTSVQSYVVTTRSPVSMLDTALDRVDSAQNFLSRCGDRYVNSITFQARIVALLTFETSGEERSEKLEGSAGVRAGAGPIALDGSLKARFTDLSKQSDVTASMRLAGQGFELDSSLQLDGTIEEKLAKMEVLGTKLAQSLKEDRERDVSSYETRNDRRAIPAFVAISRYSKATNSPDSLDTSRPFKQNQDKLRKTEEFIRVFDQLVRRMERAHRYEIGPFLDAGAESQATYNLMPPAAPVRFSADLRPIASEWDRRFRPDGDDLREVRNMLDLCVTDAKDGDFSACDLDREPKNHSLYKQGTAAMEKYLAEGRIVKMRTVVLGAGAEASYKTGLETCGNLEGWRDRLPTAEEAARLAPLVAGYGGGDKKSIWTADTASCKFEQDGLSFYSNPLSGQSSAGCDASSFFKKGSRAIICVPQSGPVGKRDEL